MGIATCEDVDDLAKRVAELEAGTAGPTAGLLEFANNAAAVAAGLPGGALYRTGDVLKVVH